MIYRSLRYLPMVTCAEIMQTGDLTLLSDEEISNNELIIIWEKLEEDFQNLSGNKDADKVFNVSKEIDFQANRYELINMACEALIFDKNEDLIDALKDFGYKITDENYIYDIQKIVKQSNGILNRIKQLQDTLPKESKVKNENSIIDVMASYASILGFDFDFFTTSVEKFFAIEKTVKAKLKALENNNTKK